MKKLSTLFATALLLCCANLLSAQCLVDTYGQYPSTSFTPNCNGISANITTLGYGGEYSVVNVTAGTAYTFASSNSTDDVTISDNTGTSAFASGVGSVVWTATITGQVRFWTHNSGCVASSTSRTRSITCGTVTIPSACNSISPIGNCPVATKPFSLAAGNGTINNVGPFGTPGNERIYTFTATVSGNYQVTLNNTTSGYVDLFFKSGACGATGWTYVDDIAGLSTVTNTVTLVGGTTYLFMVDDENTTASSGTLTIECPVPAVDPCLNLLATACGVTKTVTLAGNQSFYNTGNCFSTPGQEVIYTFTAPTNGLYTLNVASGGTADYFDYAYKPVSAGCGPTGWTCIDDASNSFGATTTFSLAAGDYYILVDKENFSTSSTVTQSWSISCPTPCAADFALTAPFVHSSSTIGAGNDCGFRASNDRQYEITIPYSGCWSFSLCGTSPTWDSYIYLTDDCCFGNTIASNDDFCGSIGNSAINNITLVAGTYYLDIEGFSASSAGDYVLEVTGTPGPSNDECANATPVIGCSFLADNTCASGTDITSCVFNDTKDVWYSWVAPCDGPVDINTCSPDRTFDTGLSLWDGCGGTQIACNDDFCGLGSQVSTNVVAGTTYLIRVAGYNGASGTVTVNISMCDTIPPVLSCPNVTVTAARGECSAVVNYAPTVSDNCVGTIDNISIPSGTVFGLGNTAVTVDASDLGGNTSTCTFDVRVEGDSILALYGVPCDISARCDRIPAAPAIVTCPAEIVNSGNGSGSGSGSGHHGSGSGSGSGHGHHGSGSGHVCDYEGGHGSGSGHNRGAQYHGYMGYISNPCTNGSGSGSGSGSGHGHGSGSGSGSGHGSCNVYCVNQGCGIYATSLCGPCPTVTLSESTIPGSCANEYDLVRTWTATDAFGNTVSQSQTIHVFDDVRPTINCQNINQCVPYGGPNSTAVSFTVNANDNCGTPTVTTSIASGSTFPIGSTWVTATATDDCGNSRSCNFRVRVYRSHNCNSKMANGDTEAEAASIASELAINAYPNPTTGMVELAITCEDCSDDHTYDLKLTDLYGKVISSHEVNIIGGRANLKLDLSQYAAGVYMVNINNMMTKIVKK